MPRVRRRRARVPGRRVPLSRAPRSRSCATSRSRPSRATTTAIVGSTGQRQVDARQPHPAPLRRDRRHGARSTASTSASSTARTCGRRIGLVPQKAFLFSGTVASNLRFGDEHATDDDLWRALRDRPGRGLRPARWRAASRRRSPRAAANVSGGQRQRLAIARALVKRRADLHLRRQLLGARLQHRRPAASRARPGARRRDRHHRRPARRDDPERRPDRRRGRPGASSASARTTSCSPRTRPTARSSTRSCPRRKPA